VTPPTPAASGVIGRLVKTELHSLFGAAGAAYGLNAHSTTALGLGIVYAVAMKLLAIAGAAVDKAAAKDTAEPVAAKIVEAAEPAVAEALGFEPASVPATAAMQAGAS
jgi:hypothetical protein